MVDLRKYFTVRQVSERLEISEESVRDLIGSKELKAVKIGRWRVKPSDLELFIKSRCNK